MKNPRNAPTGQPTVDRRWAGLVPRLRSLAGALGMRVARSLVAGRPANHGRSALEGLSGRMLDDIGVEPGQVQHGVRESHWLYDERR